MDWKCSEFRQLSPRELYAILCERSAVFVVEHAYIHLDIDGKDENALHIFALDAQSPACRVVAYARLLPGDDDDPETTIDRVLACPEHRDDGTLVELVERALVASRRTWPGHAIHLNVPVQQAAFYEDLGFKKAVGPFLEFGVPYITMIWRPLPLPNRRFSAHGATRLGSPRQNSTPQPDSLIAAMGARR